MSTIPTTFNPLSTSYTVVGGGGKNKKRELGVTLILLHRGGVVDRSSLLEKLHSLEVDEILSMERSRETYQLETLVSRFPKVRFLLADQPLNIGQQINLGVYEATNSYCFTIWGDYDVEGDTLMEGIKGVLHGSPCLCVTPWFYTQKQTPLPILQIPAFHKTKLRILSVLPQKDEAIDLFPFDYCGVYHKDSFIRLGGFDPNLPNPYWQKLDFGFRSFLWGEKIFCRKSVRGIYTKEPAVENTTPDDSYRTFFLKNLAVMYTGDRGVLPFRKFFPFYLRSRVGLFFSLREFKAAQNWVNINAYRFKMDSQTITELWEDPER